MFKSEKSRMRAIFAGIVLLTLIATLFNFGAQYNKLADKLSLPLVKDVPFHLGLDLLGGTHLVYRADVSEISDKDKSLSVEGVRDVIERRVNVFGVSEPIVQTAKAGNEYRIVVELAGVKDVNEAIKMIGETPLLEFKEENKEVKELTLEQEKEMNEFNTTAENKSQEVMRKIKAGEDFFALASEYSEADSELGWISNQSAYADIYEKASKLEPGDISAGFFEDEDGLNLIKVTDKRAAKESGEIGLDKKEVKASHILICYSGADYCESGLSKEEAKKKIEAIKSQATPATFGELAAEYSTEPGASDSMGDLGWFTREMMVDEFSNTVFNQEVGTISDVVETQFGFHIIYKQDEKTIYEYKVSRIFIDTKKKTDITGPEDPWKNTELTGKFLQRSSVQFDPNDGSPQVLLQFDSEGKDLFADITRRNVGKPVAIFLDGYPISIPTVNEAITSGDAVISGKFNIKEAKLLAQRLNAGALPVPIELINQQTVGATLGKTSMEKSLQAGIIGVILVAFFMIIFYRWPGVLAVISLIIYGLIVLAIFKLWPVTLTLAGLAGFILSIGMAVDANVLIFARLKEELRSGKTISVAINEAFRRAWPSIRDGNISTLLTCFVLIQFTTSIVKGFAITLALGVLVSMFSAIVITKYLMKITMKEGIENKRWLFGIK